MVDTACSDIPVRRPRSDSELLCWIIAAIIFSVGNGMWLFAPSIGGPNGWSVGWVLSELYIMIRGMIYLFGAFLVCIGGYRAISRHRWFRPSTDAIVLGLIVVSLNLILGFCSDAVCNRGYVRGYWDGLHRRPPVDFRSTEIIPAVEQLYLGKQKER